MNSKFISLCKKSSFVVGIFVFGVSVVISLGCTFLLSLCLKSLARILETIDSIKDYGCNQCRETSMSGKNESWHCQQCGCVSEKYALNCKDCGEYK